MLSEQTKLVGYAPGIFDLFHIGHLNLLRGASEHCDQLVAGVLSDEMAWRNKGAHPIVPQEERRSIVEAISYVDQAVLEDVHHKREMWEQIQFDVIIKGDDWKDTDRGEKLEGDFAEIGVNVVYLKYTDRTSSTTLRRVLDRMLDP